MRRPGLDDDEDDNYDDDDDDDNDDGGSESDGDCSYFVTKDLLLEFDADTARNLDNTKT